MDDLSSSTFSTTSDRNVRNAIVVDIVNSDENENRPCSSQSVQLLENQSQTISQDEL